MAEYGDEKPRRGKGRPRKGEAPALPVKELDRLLVFGELVETETGPTVRYPSYAELGERFGVSSSLVAKYAQDHNCQKRRVECAARVEARTDQKLVEMRSGLAAKTKEDELRIIDGYIEGFEQALQDGRIRFDSPADFNSMVRLKQFVLGGADSRSEVTTNISLEEIQRRHRLQLNAVHVVPEEAFGVPDGGRYLQADTTEDAPADGQEEHLEADSAGETADVPSESTEEL